MPLLQTNPGFSDFPGIRLPRFSFEHLTVLSFNESPYPPSPKVRDALLAAYNYANRYPHWYLLDSLRSKIREYLNVLRAEVVITPGSEELLRILLLAYGGSDRRAVSVEPTFGTFRLFAHLTQTPHHPVLLKERGDTFVLDVAEWIAQLDERTIAYLCTPNNPTGNHLPEDAIEEAVNRAGLVIVDEAYAEFTGQNYAAWVEQYPNLIALRTFSKAFALAGMRIGYAIAHRTIAEQLRKLIPYFFVSIASVFAATAALTDLEYMNALVAKLRAERVRLHHLLKQAGAWVYRSETNFLLIDVQPLRLTGEDAYRQLRERGVLVRPCWHDPGLRPTHLRISVGKPQENERVARILARIPGREQ